jgi:hypothetical protein
VIERQELKYISMEAVADHWSPRISSLHNVSKEMLRSSGIPLVEVPLTDLLSTYGSPPLRRREHIRKASRLLWPSLDSLIGIRCCSDAASLGLHVQIQRILASAEAPQ